MLEGRKRIVPGANLVMDQIVSPELGAFELESLRQIAAMLSHTAFRPASKVMKEAAN
jgi:hypothetical protein